MFDGVEVSTILASAEAEECLGAEVCNRPRAELRGPFRSIDIPLNEVVWHIDVVILTAEIPSD